jgi:hypothetical protein
MSRSTGAFIKLCDREPMPSDLAATLKSDKNKPLK